MTGAIRVCLCGVTLVSQSCGDGGIRNPGHYPKGRTLFLGFKPASYCHTCVILGNLFNLSEPQFLLWGKNGDQQNIPTGLMQELDKSTVLNIKNSPNAW